MKKQKGRGCGDIEGRIFDKARDAGSYDSVSAAYDRHTQGLAGPLAEHLCTLAEIRPGQRVLDVGTGTGVAAREAARRVTPSGEVIGIDLSGGMIGVAQQAKCPSGSALPKFQVMDAEDLELPNESFDTVISLCAVLHFPNVQTAIAEMRRVLKPRGTIVVSLGRVRPIRPILWVVHMTREFARLMLRPFKPSLKAPGDLERFIPPRAENHVQAILTLWGQHNPEKRLLHEMRQAGFGEVAAVHWSHEVYFQSAEAFWEAQVSIGTEIRRQLEIMPKAAFDELKRDYIRRVQSVLDRGGRLSYRFGAFYVRGIRPADGRARGVT